MAGDCGMRSWKGCLPAPGIHRRRACLGSVIARLSRIAYYALAKCVMSDMAREARTASCCLGENRKRNVIMAPGLLVFIRQRRSTRGKIEIAVLGNDASCRSPSARRGNHRQYAARAAPLRTRRAARKRALKYGVNKRACALLAKNQETLPT